MVIANPRPLSRLDKNQYSTIDEFVNDLRLISANCLQFNSNPFDSMKNDDSFRTIAVNFLDTSEKLCNFFIVQHELSSTSSSSTKLNVYPTLLHSWLDCVKVIDEMIQLINPTDGIQTSWYFMEPVSYYCGGLFPDGMFTIPNINCASPTLTLLTNHYSIGYLEKIKKPIDFGTITHNLILGRYTSVMQFASDCKQVFENCLIFYAGSDDVTLCEQATRLLKCITKHLTPLLDAEKKNPTTSATSNKPVMTIKRPKKEFLKDVMRDLRATTYTDKAVKLTENSTLHFEKPVDTSMFPDYLDFVQNPMDLETVDRKIESGSCKSHASCISYHRALVCIAIFILTSSGFDVMLFHSRLRRCNTRRLRI